MGFSTLLGQPTATKTLESALSSRRVHHAYRFEGPAGVGKETAAFLLAQALVCPEAPFVGCGTCSACRRAVTLSTSAPEVPQHPDVLLVGRGVYPSALLGGASEATGISVEQIRRIVLGRVGYTPHESSALVVIIKSADELTVAAGNALLKTLEEPSKGVHFILVTSRPRKLLDTIRSRTLAVRFGALPLEVVETLAEREGLPKEVAPYAQGSMDQARTLAEPEAREQREAFVRALDDALAQGHPAAALTFANARPEARDALLQLLAHTASTFAIRSKTSGQLSLWAARYKIITRSIQKIEANGSPGLVLESMVLDLGAL